MKLQNKMTTTSQILTNSKLPFKTKNNNNKFKKKKNGENVLLLYTRVRFILIMNPKFAKLRHLIASKKESLKTKK